MVLVTEDVSDSSVMTLMLGAQQPPSATARSHVPSPVLVLQQLRGCLALAWQPLRC